MTRLHFLDPNPGGSPVVLLLHGLGATGDSWRLQFPALAEKGYRPLAPDMPGFGDSPYDGRGWNLRRAAEQVVALMDEQGIGSAHVIGLSMGGVIAQHLAHGFPARVRRLVLASTFASLKPENLSGWSYFFRRALAISFLGLRAQAGIVARRVFPAPAQETLREMLVETICRADARAYRAAMISLGRFDARRWESPIPVPTLVICGEQDTTISPNRQKVLQAIIPDARLAIIQHAGHAANVDQPDEFNRLVLEFLA